jgi:hypothetical protein
VAHREITDPIIVGRLLKGTALEAMSGKSVHYSPEFIHDLRSAIDEGVTIAIDEKVDFQRMLPHAERSVKNLIATATRRTMSENRLEVDIQAFSAAREQVQTSDCSWPFC